MIATLRQKICFTPNIWLHRCDTDGHRFSYLHINNDNENVIMYIFQVDFHNKECCAAGTTISTPSLLLERVHL